MKLSKEQIEKLERALTRAHAAEDAPQFSMNWVYAVMRDIRQEASTARTTMEIPRLMWRAATVVVFLSMMVVGSVLAWNADIRKGSFGGLFTETTLGPGLL